MITAITRYQHKVEKIWLERHEKRRHEGELDLNGQSRSSVLDVQLSSALRVTSDAAHATPIASV